CVGREAAVFCHCWFRQPPSAFPGGGKDHRQPTPQRKGVSVMRSPRLSIPAPRGSACAVAALAIILPNLSATASAGDGSHLRFTQEYGFTFSEVGDPGNPAYVYDNIVPGKPPNRIGSVNHRYRIATTEVTVAQWGEFILAYSPFVGENYGDPGFYGLGYHFAGFDSKGIPQYGFNPDGVNNPSVMGWRYIARYCHWLH